MLIMISYRNIVTVIGVFVELQSVWRCGHCLYCLINLLSRNLQDRFANVEKFSLNFSSWLFIIRVNLLHPCLFMVYYYL